MEDHEKAKTQLIDQARAACQRIAARKESQVQRKREEEVLQNERELLWELVNLQQRELKLIGYEIHDGLVQQLTGALWQLHTYRKQRDVNRDEAQRTFEGAIQLLSDVMDEARGLIGGLTSPLLDESGIVPAVDCLVGDAGRLGGPEIEFVHNFHVERMAPPLERAIFRIVQESLTNACRHSRSKRVRVQLTKEDGHIRIEVQDWGIGFNAERVDKNRFGLQGIRERVRLLHGEINVDTAQGEGTRIAVRLPGPGKERSGWNPEEDRS